MDGLQHSKACSPNTIRTKLILRPRRTLSLIRYTRNESLDEWVEDAM